MSLKNLNLLNIIKGTIFFWNDNCFNKQNGLLYKKKKSKNNNHHTIKTSFVGWLNKQSGPEAFNLFDQHD